MKIGVSGASGALGRMVVDELKRRAPEHLVVAISRTPEAIAASTMLERRLGDYDRPDILRDAFAGLDRLLLIPSPDLRPGVIPKQIAVAIDKAIASGVGHIVLMSGSGTRHASGYADHWTGEQHLLRRDAAAWTIARLNFFAETFADLARMSLGMGMLPGFSENRVAFLAKADAAAALAGVLLAEEQAGQTHNLSGRTAVSGAERAALISELTGQPLAFAIVDETRFRTGLAQAAMPDFLIDGFAAMQRAFSQGAYDIVTGDVARLAGRPPRPLRAALADVFVTASMENNAGG